MFSLTELTVPILYPPHDTGGEKHIETKSFLCGGLVYCVQQPDNLNNISLSKLQIIKYFPKWRWIVEYILDIFH